MSNGNGATTRVLVDRVILEADMRMTRALVRDSPGLFRQIRFGHTILMVNRARTIVRLLDSQFGLHTYYSPDGDTFDTAKLVEQAKERILAIGVQVIAGRGMKMQRSRQFSVPSKKKKKSRKRRAA